MLRRLRTSCTVDIFGLQRHTSQVTRALMCVTFGSIFGVASTCMHREACGCSVCDFREWWQAREEQEKLSMTKLTCHWLVQTYTVLWTLSQSAHAFLKFLALLRGLLCSTASSGVSNCLCGPDKVHWVFHIAHHFPKLALHDLSSCLCLTNYFSVIGRFTALMTIVLSINLRLKLFSWL